MGTIEEILQNYRDEMEKIEKLGEGEIEDIKDVKTYITHLKQTIEEQQEEYESLNSECDRLGELENIIWTDFWDYERVEDDTKAYRFRLEIVDMKKENKDLKEENKSLKVEMEAKTRVNLFLAEQWRELRHTMDLSKVLGLDEETSNDVAICHVATEFIKQKLYRC